MKIPRFADARMPWRERQPHLAARFDADARIGVIGAGAAGLTVARTLLQNGFRHVTVLERNGHVGGKCSTFVHEGRTYELGAVALSPAYSSVRELLTELGIKAVVSPENALLSGDWRRGAFVPPLFVDVSSTRATFLPAILHDESLRRVGASCLRLGREMIRHRSLRAPGLSGMPKETFVPFEQWAREGNIAEAARLVVDPLFTPLGYGYLADTPAAYVLKYLTLAGVPPYLEILDGGYQGLWEAVARGIDVRRNVTVRRVRRAEQVVVETDGETFTFDALVLTSPLDEAISFLDATAEEAELAAKIVYNDYRVVVASADGLPDHRYVLVPKHFEPSTRGELIFWYKRWQDKNVYTFYAYGREGTSIDETTARIAETVGRLGGTLTSVHRAMKWRYFPHVSGQDMARGFYERFDQMQGVRHTYYAGELLALGLVETVVRQARDLVDRHFVGARDRGWKPGTLSA